MATHDNYPGASSRLKNGKTIWRFRGKGKHAKQTNLPGQPGDPEFENAYREATQGVRLPKAGEIVELPLKAGAKTFAHAQRLLEKSAEWLELDAETHVKNTRMLEIFLNANVDPAYKLKWRDCPVEYLRPKDIRDFLNPIRTVSPTKSKHILVALRKLIAIAVAEQWIEIDPSHTIKAPVPPTNGHKPWPRWAREQYEARHPIGSAARTAYALGFWLGNRRGDIAHLAWDTLVEEEVETGDGDFETVMAFDFRQRKNRKRNGGKEMFLKVTRPLQAALAPLSRDTETVLVTAYGKPFSEKSLTGMMAHWTRQAELPAGYTLHGLRKSLGIYLAENGASARQIQDVLGHESMRESDTYIKMANRKRLATDALSIVEERENRRSMRPRLSVVR
ncbi:tyrosine-type recombinase/integrase [Sinorhizobium fredii]|uniref:tyrosine-type recombinase/integrase n=1 Tax=Rhizobium fredii TaxID=380 RepID=UPI003513E398